MQKLLPVKHRRNLWRKYAHSNPGKRCANGVKPWYKILEILRGQQRETTRIYRRRRRRRRRNKVEWQVEKL